jgi:anti-sigma B factor antagonist
MNFILTEKNDISILKAPERLEAAVSIEFRKKILDIVDHESYKLIIDLSDTIFIDSNGISSLVARIHVCRSNNGDVRLVQVSAKVKDILELTNLNKIFQIFSDVEQAIKSFQE